LIFTRSLAFDLLTLSLCSLQIYLYLISSCVPLLFVFVSNLVIFWLFSKCHRHVCFPFRIRHYCLLVVQLLSSATLWDREVKKRVVFSAKLHYSLRPILPFANSNVSSTKMCLSPTEICALPAYIH
jgi:hypothetical protein